jgi:ATP-dependent DNA helicase RecG
MSLEDDTFDCKSLRMIQGRTSDWREIAADCVCFANAAGGRLRIGIEDGQMNPPSGQTIEESLLIQVRKRIGELTINVQVAPRIVTADNGGQFIEVEIARSVGVASTSDGRYFLRVGDTCRPLVGDEVMRLMDERPAQPWETLTSLNVLLRDADVVKQARLLQALRASDRVKQDVKEKSDAELLSHYGLGREGRLTHLGVLLIGSAHDRARLGTAPLVQGIKYDERGDKVNKWSWDDYSMSPIDLVDAVWSAIPDFRESHELPDGLYRQHVPAYELLVNALVHRPYTQRGDVYLNLHPDRLEVTNPGRLPLGVTPQNILHQSRRRNDRLATIFHDLKLMEREGTGYDLMYDVQLSQGRTVPEAKEGADSVTVTVRRRILKPAVIKLLADADARFQLRRRERITLGLLAMSEGLTARQLSTALELEDGESLKSWLGRLPELGVLGTSGRTQGMRYYVDPVLLRASGLEGKTTLVRIEPHRLEALVLEDLARYPGASSSEVNRRIAPEIGIRAVRSALERLESKGEVRHEGEKRWRRYWTVKTN